MDPYLERHWLDVHTKLVAYAADELNRVLPETLVARTEERVAVESDWEGSRKIGPEVRVFSPASADPTTPRSAVRVDAPLLPHLCPGDALSTYRVTIRTPPGAAAYLFPAPLRSPLPDVPVPLRPEDPKVLLPLQRLADQVYANGRYGMTINYRQPCDPPLEGEDATWADELLRQAGRRGAR